MEKVYLTLGIVAAGFVAACASTAAESDSDKGIAAFNEDPRLGEEVKKICFNRNIDGFSNATRHTVVLGAGPSKDYIVEVSGVCPTLRFAQSIAIDSSLSCVTRGDYLLVSDSAFSLNDGSGMGPDRCLINKIHKWDKRVEENEQE